MPRSPRSKGRSGRARTPAPWPRTSVLGGRAVCAVGLSRAHRILRRKGGAVRRSLSIVLLVFVAAACGDARPAGTPALSTGSFPATIQASSGSVTIPARPARIVSLSPSSTEILFAIGAGAQVIAVDDQSNYPATVPKTTLSGFEPNIEAIASYRPDLVVFSNKAIAEKLTALS